MSFLQPWLLIALPLVSLPVIIHLINQRRYQTVRWGAMMFLLAANRMSRGYAKLRQWLILAARMLAIAGLIFAISRPLASGLLGMTAGGRSDATLVLIDRSPSMNQTSAQGSDSKLTTGRRQLEQTLRTLGTNRLVVFESGSREPRELLGTRELVDSPQFDAVSAPSDLPGLLEAAQQYIRANQMGRADVWICSDLRVNDWQPDSSRWRAIREAFQSLPQSPNIHLLAYSEVASDNLSLRVHDVRRITTGENAELSLTLTIAREGEGGEGTVQVPVQFEIGGARSELSVELVGGRFELKDHRIPLDRNQPRGAGVVSLPADANESDNHFYFAFDEAIARKTVVVTENPEQVTSLLLAANIAPDSTVVNEAVVVSPTEWSERSWEDVALVIWQGVLPEGAGAEILQRHLDRDGAVLCFPAIQNNSTVWNGMQWGEWTESKDALSVSTWRTDEDLLRNTQSGAALPVGQIKVNGYAKVSGETIHLATLTNGDPLLARATTARGSLYFCSTLPDSSHSNLSADGIVMYVCIQRALETGSIALQGSRDIAAGTTEAAIAARWQRLLGESALSNEQALSAGVYADDERLVAVNRPAVEDQAPVLADERLASLFEGLQFARVDDQAGMSRSLVQEVWRLFLSVMIAALILEAALCLPKAPRVVPGGT